MTQRSFLLAFLALLVANLGLAAPASAARIKDMGQFQGMRANQLTGYGIVVGLAGTGDDSLDYSTLGMKGAVSRFGLTLPAGVNPALKNAAAVMITVQRNLIVEGRSPESANWRLAATISDPVSPGLSAVFPGIAGQPPMATICR